MGPCSRSLHRQDITRAAAIVGLLLVASASLAAPPVLPPLNEPPTAQYLPGKFVWADLVSPDVAAARRFYGKLFGWSFRTLGGDGRPYTLVYNGEVPVAGMIQRRADSRPAAGRWVAFMSVGDVNRASQFVMSKGGKVLVEPQALPDRGELAILADPDGVPIGVVNSSSGDQDDFLVEHGEWIWALYQSPAAERAAAFYQDLGGYEIVVDEGRFTVPHFLLVAQGYARASLLQIPDGNTRLQPGWLYFIRVADLDAQLAEAGRLGGRTLVAPRSDLLDGRIAVIADPGGAPLGLMQWEPEAGEVTP